MKEKLDFLEANGFSAVEIPSGDWPIKNCDALLDAMKGRKLFIATACGPSNFAYAEPEKREAEVQKFLPVIEALGNGVPTLSSTGGALPEVVGPDNETALLVPPGDSDALAARIKGALADKPLRNRIGKAGRARVVDHWSWRHTAEKTVEQYRLLLDEA